MKRWFSGLISQITLQVANLFRRKDRKQDEGQQKGADRELSQWSVNANGLSPYSPAQIQTAKDFIWNNLPAHTQGLMIVEANTEVLLNHGLEVKCFILSAEYK